VLEGFLMFLVRSHGIAGFLHRSHHTPAANRQRNKFPGTIEAGQRRRYHPL
jgi:hypothetical protein